MQQEEKAQETYTMDIQRLMLGCIFGPVLPGGESDEGNINYEIYTVLRNGAG